MYVKNLNFEIAAGSKVAIVGESGSGKSTIVNLIERLYEINSGEITIDNINLYDINLEYRRSMIGYVIKEPVVFNISLKENILFGRENSNFLRCKIMKLLKNLIQMNLLTNLRKSWNIKQ